MSVLVSTYQDGGEYVIRDVNGQCRIDSALRVVLGDILVLLRRTDQVDAWLGEQHAGLVDGLGEVLDVEAGLQEIIGR